MRMYSSQFVCLMCAARMIAPKYAPLLSLAFVIHLPPRFFLRQSTEGAAIQLYLAQYVVSNRARARDIPSAENQVRARAISNLFIRKFASAHIYIYNELVRN